MRFSELDGKAIGVWGAGVETRSFAGILARELPSARIAVAVLENAADEAPEITGGARVVGAGEAAEALSGCDVVVRGPGVSLHRPELRAVAARGVPITTATGLWMAERGGRNVIAVTATKGKSTTATLIAHLVRAAGRPVELAGNIGRPALELLGTPDDVLAVVELSSFQIADLPCGPETAMASNLHPEHLDWHGTFDVYREDKLRLLALPGVRRCVLNEGSDEVMAAPRAADSDVFLYGRPPGWHVRVDGSVALGADVVVPFDRLPLIGDHNALNVCGALTALQALDIPLPPLPDALEDFEGLSHRLQVVRRDAGITWIDDSISTTPVTAAEAIRGVRKWYRDCSVILIGGGFDRDQDYAELGRLIAETGTTVLGLPDTGARLVQAALEAGASDAREVADLPAAVAAAKEAAAPGTVVLLSPGAASYNSHENFKARGEHFQALA
ncbi:MAG: UDP-N-acetylmuramoyl-L-alanine--D-glutamate ligase [Solirubrobacteraceae bacterium]|nr:UDP-N-acetylmuramoyl-L-alanine--D-glutamate ligase [Solirubrobacteraceae bacterium]